MAAQFSSGATYSGTFVKQNLTVLPNLSVKYNINLNKEVNGYVENVGVQAFTIQTHTGLSFVINPGYKFKFMHVPAQQLEATFGNLGTTLNIFVIESPATGLQYEIDLKTILQSTQQTQPVAMPIGGFTSPGIGILIIRGIGANAVATLTLNGTAYNLDEGATLVTGAIYEWELHLNTGDVVGATANLTLPLYLFSQGVL
jgi:hypothetical protein